MDAKRIETKMPAFRLLFFIDHKAQALLRRPVETLVYKALTRRLMNCTSMYFDLPLFWNGTTVQLTAGNEIDGWYMGTVDPAHKIIHVSLQGAAEGLHKDRDAEFAKELFLTSNVISRQVDAMMLYQYARLRAGQSHRDALITAHDLMSWLVNAGHVRGDVVTLRRFDWGQHKEANMRHDYQHYDVWLAVHNLHSWMSAIKAGNAPEGPERYWSTITDEKELDALVQKGRINCKQVQHIAGG